ncbi:MAG: diguanylate cyclase [Candidatus Obscuribacterales bacterium]|nr:diguanylate cyclase [Cyanobacteria bacterium SZAS LIN-5]RTL42626.1 MAG: diguanylate cyclase [Candidatus Melainabacteria bacterium]
MYNDPKKNQFQNKAKEALFHQRLADLRSQNAQFPWSTPGELPQFDIPKEESKLLANREVEGPGVSDAELERRALLDLTSLSSSFNQFYKRLNYEIQRARRYKRPLSIILVGIDDLEKIGLKCSSETKNAVVESVAKMLLASIRDVDVPGRCREDCFGVILPETPVSGAEVAAERIRTKMEQMTVQQQWQATLVITVSVGAASYPEDGDVVEELFAACVEALMSAMQQGGNAVNFAGRS